MIEALLRMLTGRPLTAEHYRLPEAQTHVLVDHSHDGAHKHAGVTGAEHDIWNAGGRRRT